MRIESVGPSKQMLSACLEQGIDFSIKYRGGVSIVVKKIRKGWCLSRFKNDTKTSDVSIYTDYDWSGILVESKDEIVKAMINGMNRYNSFEAEPEVYEAAAFVVSVLDIYGGPVKHITSVHTL